METYQFSHFSWKDREPAQERGGKTKNKRKGRGRGAEYRWRKCKREGAPIDIFFDKTGNDELFNVRIATVSRLRIVARIRASTYTVHQQLRV